MLILQTSHPCIAMLEYMLLATGMQDSHTNSYVSPSAILDKRTIFAYLMLFLLDHWQQPNRQIRAAVWDLSREIAINWLLD